LTSLCGLFELARDFEEVLEGEVGFASGEPEVHPSERFVLVFEGAWWPPVFCLGAEGEEHEWSFCAELVVEDVGCSFVHEADVDVEVAVCH
jgi:hypothetical protein